MASLISERRFYCGAMDNTIQGRLETIKNVLPFEVTKLDIHDGGDDFLVIEVNGEWMFRFSRQEISRKAFAVEKTFLSKFRCISPLPIPDYHYEGYDFGGYPKIHGTLLTPDMFAGLSEPVRTRIALQMGQFLSAIHNYPVPEASCLGVTEGWGGWYVKIFENFKEAVAPLLSASARKNTLLCLDQILMEPFELSVIHGDFALEDHVFFDQEQQELCGVIDFADVTIHDPAYDFQNILEYGSEEYFDEVMRHYRGIINDTFLKRTKLHIESRPMREASYSLLFGFEKRFKNRMEYLEARYG